jgi:hypothetical protein
VTLRGTLARLLAALLFVSAAAPVPLEAATKKKAPARRTVASKKAKPKRPTAAQRAAARREAARRRAAELERQRQALAKAWQADKGCYAAGSAFTEPRLRTDEPIDVPKRFRGGSMKAALMMYEAKLDRDGRLNSLRTLRPLPRESPWPELHAAVVEAVREWKWDKTKVAGKTIPVCFPLTLNLDLR